MIYKSRLRPRYRSISVRTLFWLVRLEAEMWVVSGYVWSMSRPRFFGWWMSKNSTARRRLTARALGRFPDRGVKP